MPWCFMALGAALIWGVHYPLVDFALKRVSVFSVLAGGLLVIAGAGVIICNNQ